MRRAYDDTALSANAIAMGGLRSLLGVEQILFGTDYPFALEASTQATVAGLDGLGWSADDLRHAERANAAQLFPRLG